MKHIDTDVVVVGARVAGSATAMLLARQGLDVVVLDRATELGDTVSTHCIARGGVVQLARWGLLDEVLATGAPPIRSVSFNVPEGVITRRVKERSGVDHLVAPRRRALDPVLAGAAEDAGAEVRLGTRVTDLRFDADGRVSGVVAIDRDGQPLCINARYVVGADGWHSRVAAMTGAATLEHHVPDTTCMLTYFAGIPWDAMELYASAGGYAGVFPTNDGAASIWVITGAAAAKTARGDLDGDEAILALLAGPAPSLAERLRGGHRTDPLRVATRLPSFLRQAAGRGWALVGDAGYQRDAITGHGITDALRDAELLARALGQALGGETDEQAALDQYGAARDAALRPIFDVTNEMATLPSLDRFVELQIALSNHMEAEADAIASYPPLPVATAAAA